MILSIVKEPNAILHERAIPVMEMTPEIQRIIDDMMETMYVAEGVGLAANQIGLKWDILVASPEGTRAKEISLINAEIVARRGRFRSPEGCLSLPGVSSEVSRAAEVTVQGLDRRFKPVIFQAEGLLAKILQHEIDHLHGYLYVDRLRFFKRQRILRRYKRMAEILGRVKV